MPLNDFLIYFVFIICSAIITTFISPFIIKSITDFLQKLSQISIHNQDDRVIFSCWSGSSNNPLLTLIIWLIISTIEISILRHNLLFLTISVFTLTFLLLILIWNSLIIIEITTIKNFIYQLNFGAKTEIYSFTKDEISNINIDLTIGPLFSGGLQNWLIIYLKSGEKIILNPPPDNKIELLLDFLKQSND
jgi:hypothetical protein